MPLDPQRADATLAYRPPLAWAPLRDFLLGRGAAGVEARDGERYLRTVELDGQRGWFAAAPLPAQPALALEVSASLLPVLAQLLARVRRLFDLEADPAPIAARLGADARLRPLLARRPGLRIPGAFDGFELALRAVLGQQVTVKAATTLFGRFAAAFGAPAVTPHAALRLFAPTAQRVAAARLQKIIDLGLTRQRAASVHALARAVAGGELTLAPAADAAATLDKLRALPGIGPWTAQYIALRALGDADAFPPGDLGLLRALRVKDGPALERRAQRWRPWRGYAAIHLWIENAGG